MNKQRNTSFVLAGVLTSLLAISSEASAQDHGWGPNVQRSCTQVRTSLAENMRQITTKGTGRVSIAHRGAYSQPLPDSGALFPAENTILAFQFAQCQGFAGVEVDLKLTSDNVLILGHDLNLMRFTNYDFNDGTFNPELDAEIRNASGTITRPRSGNPSPKISGLSWPNIAAELEFVKTYDENGRMRQNISIMNNNSMKLREVLVKAKSDPTMSKLAWILDIQDYNQLRQSLSIVDSEDLWDRVIFKVWLNAMPMRVNASGDFDVDDSVVPDRGHWVFSVGPPNSRLTNNVLETRYYTINQTEDHWGETSELTKALDRWADGKCTGDCSVDGFELFVSGSGDQLENAIKAVQNQLDQLDFPGRQWGVIRIADFFRKNCEASTEGCSTFPNGQYFGNAPTLPSNPSLSYVRLYSIPESDIVNRRNYAESRQVETEDIRWPNALRRSINSPNQRANFISAISAAIQ